jgi:hypothetical protein
MLQIFCKPLKDTEKITNLGPHTKFLKKNSVALVRKRSIPTEPTFADRWCRVVSATDAADH